MTQTLAAFFELLTDNANPYQEWRERANCRGLGPELFFPPRGTHCVEAKEVCAGCEVRAECLEFAQANKERHGGVWGGMSERQRRKARSEARREREGLRRAG